MRCDGTERYGFVPDSSAIHSNEPPVDGRRMAVACSADHMRQLNAQATARPYSDAELWAGKLLRALEDACGWAGAGYRACRPGTPPSDG